ncbi:hypothetical protein PANT_12c00096 [Moesziomyces antarcticus T-34]|uniref:Galactose oxidase n=1 Tax=Pseudozyma antarctica (strain T-34) TaxID=1151754 RepID=M9MFW8_PSEA3|nr:hypothetical protein PANT_12c00096 [Moesziomyces antarcticus T-34]
MWLLRSILVALLLPYVAALPSSYVSDPRRSARLEPGSARHLPQPRNYQPVARSQLKVGRDLASTPAQPGHLDRDRSSTADGKRRELDPQDVLRSARLRRDEVFPSVVAIDAASDESAQDDSGRTLTIVFEKADGTESNVTLTPPSRRWGQTATFMPAHNIVLVVGGQTSISGDITNDVYALDASQLTPSGQNTSASSQSWQRLSSEGLPAHAFAAATSAVDPADGSEKLWIVGGVTQSCAQDAPAYVWSAPVGNITAGKWTAVYTDDGVTPSRRRGAKAVTITSANATSVMVSGGTFDASTCATTTGTYAGVDMWTESSAMASASSLVSASAETAHVGIDITGSAYASVQSLALDSRMRDFSLTDYTTVVLPANGTCGEKVLFLGGKSQAGQMAPLDRFWALDMATGNWEHWNATGLIPAGRMGHTAVVTPDGKVIIHGGYLEDPSEFTTENDPIDEVFILDPHQSPARWDAAVWTSESSAPPALAFHSAVMASDVMVTSFGKLSDGPLSDYSSQSFIASGQNAASPVHFLDTATLSNAGGLTWSTSAAGVAEARQAVANTVAAGQVSAPAQSEAAPAQQAPVAPAVATEPVQPAAIAAPSEEAKPEVAAPTPAAAPSDDGDKAGQKDGASDAGANSNHTGAIAGSLLGAAAVAAAIGGIYAYRKRKEAAAYNLGRDAGNRDAEADLARFHGDEEKGDRAPPVSSLYLRGDGAVAAAAGGAGWSARLKRAASTLNRSKPEGGAADDKYTSTPKPLMTLGNIAPRRNAGAAEPQHETVAKRDLPDHFITQLADDESPFVFCDNEPLGRGELLMPTDDGRGELKLLHTNASHASLATVGTIESNAAASHFSYPYLSGMHRGSSPRSYNSEHTTGGVQRVRVILGTPESCYDKMHMSPGDVVSPYHLPRNPHASPESLFLNFDLDHAHDDDLDTNVAVDGVSVAPQDIRTPVFPWDTPAITAPAPAKIIEPTGNGRTMSMLRAQPTSLHVTNAW